MASFEDYDEFGNYIGADIDSDEEGDVNTEIPHAQQQQPLEGYDDEPVGGDPGTALMEVDGELHSQLMRVALNTL
jgi:U5 small nuclear ribonucleoprotein component